MIHKKRYGFKNNKGELALHSSENKDRKCRLKLNGGGLTSLLKVYVDLNYILHFIYFLFFYGGN